MMMMLMMMMVVMMMMVMMMMMTMMMMMILILILMLKLILILINRHYLLDHPFVCSRLVAKANAETWSSLVPEGTQMVDMMRI